MEDFKIDSALAKKAAEQLRSGKSLFGKDGALAPMLERILNAALEGEMDAHLSESTREEGNRRNGKMSKRVQTPYGEVTVDTPRDRDGSFQPEIVIKPNYKTFFTPGIQRKAHASTKEIMVVVTLMNTNLPNAPIQTPSKTYWMPSINSRCRT